MSDNVTFEDFCKVDIRAGLSKNIFKRIDDENFIIMATYRKYDGVYESFKESLEKIKNDVLNAGFEIEKTIVEFSVYDSRVNHDAAWLMS